MQLRVELKDGLTGAIVALISSLCFAILFAYTFRVPIPFVGYSGPFGEFSTYSVPIPELLRSVFAAWWFYGLFGGFIILPIAGFLAGILVGGRRSGQKNKFAMIALWSAAIGGIAVFFLSILDFIIGPW